MSPAGAKENETAFFILTFKYLDWMEQKGEYEQYRLKRSECARVYAKGLLERYPHLERVIGISCEPPGQEHGGSEDLVYAEQTEWTDEDRRAIKRDCKTYGVLQGQIGKIRGLAKSIPTWKLSPSREWHSQRPTQV